MALRTIAGILILILLVYGAYLLSSKNSTILFFKQEPIKTLKDNKQYINEDSVRLKIKAEYPQIENQKLLNQHIKELIDDLISQFKKDAANNSLSLDKEIKNEIDISYQTYLLTGNLASFDFQISSYLVGMAHPSNSHLTFNYDLKKNKKVILTDVFIKDSDYLNILSGIAVEKLIEKFAGDQRIPQNDPMYKDMVEWIRKGAGPEGENYQKFLLEKNNFVALFDTYQVAAGAVGAQKVEIPYSILEKVLNPEFRTNL